MKNHRNILSRLAAALLCGLLLLSPAALAVVEPTSVFYVADYADVLSSDTENYIVQQNEALWEATGAQLVVVTVDFLDGMYSDEYAAEIFHSWGIGDADANNGFLLLLSPGEGKGWAMVGRGLEDSLTASKLDGWLNDYFWDDFDAGNYDAAVMCAGLCGHGIGATPSAIVNMTSVKDRYGMSRRAFMIVPIVGAFLVDIIYQPQTIAFIKFFVKGFTG